MTYSFHLGPLSINLLWITFTCISQDTCTYALIFLGGKIICLGMNLLGCSIYKNIVSFSRYCQNHFSTKAVILFPTTKTTYETSSCFASLSSLELTAFLNFSYFSVNIKIPHFVFLLIAYWWIMLITIWGNWTKCHCTFIKILKLKSKN